MQPQHTHLVVFGCHVGSCRNEISYEGRVSTSASVMQRGASPVVRFLNTDGGEFDEVGDSLQLTSSRGQKQGGHSLTIAGTAVYETSRNHVDVDITFATQDCVMEWRKPHFRETIDVCTTELNQCLHHSQGATTRTDVERRAIVERIYAIAVRTSLC